MQTRSALSQFLAFVGGSFLVLMFFSFFSLLFLGRGSSIQHGNLALVQVEGPLDAELARTTIEKLIRYRKEKSVKAVILRIDSPGGPIAPAQEVYAEVQKTVKVKPVVVSMGSVAASGGYYIAAPASKIVANPSTITGSLGVIMEHYMVDAIARKFQLRWEIIKAGEVKDMGSPLRDFTYKERTILTELTREMHEQFIEHVAAGRKIPADEVRKLANGAIYSGSQAKKLKLVDALGSEQQAIAMAAQLVDIQEEDIKMTGGVEKPNLLERLLEQSIGKTVSRGITQILTQPVTFSTRF